MTDEQMDARLQAAGERWRLANASVATVEPPATTDPTAEVRADQPRRRHWGLFASAAAVAAALVVGGAFVVRGANDPAPSGDTVALEGHVWRLDNAQLADSATLYIDRHGNLVADDGCRLIGASLAIDGDHLTAGSPVVRYKSCTDDSPGDFGDADTAALTGSSTYRIEQSRLTLTTQHDVLQFRLDPRATIPTLDYPTLVGQHWTLTAATDANGTAVAVAGSPTLKIADDGTVTGSDGCNTLAGKVRIVGPGIKVVDGLGGTDRLCLGAEGKTEQAVLATFDGTVAQTVTQGELTFRRGQSTLVYRWTPGGADHDPKALDGVTWTLPSDGTTLRIDTGRVRLSWCTGSVPIDLGAGTLSVHDAGSWPSGCGKAPDRSLAEFLVQGAPAWDLRDGSFVIYEGGTQQAAYVFGNASSPPRLPQLLTGRTWTLDTITAPSHVRYRNGAPSADPVRVQFAGRGVTVRHECYTDTGSTTVAGSSVTFGPFAVGQALPCPYRVGRDAAAGIVDTILHGTVNWSVDNGVLRIDAGPTGTLRFVERRSPITRRPLVGTPWRLETAVHGDQEHVAGGQRLKFTTTSFAADDGLNPISGPVSEQDGALTFSGLSVGAAGSTRTDPVRTIVDTVVADGQTQYSIDGNVLTLTRGTDQLIYRAG